MREWRLFSLSWLPRDRWIIKIGNVIGVLRSDWLARRGFKGCIRTCVPNCFARWKFYLLLSGETETHTKHDHQRHNYGVIANTFYLIATLMRISRSNVYYDTILISEGVRMLLFILSSYCLNTKWLQWDLCTISRQINNIVGLDFCLMWRRDSERDF